MIKSQICDNVSLYAQQYDEEFQVENEMTKYCSGQMIVYVVLCCWSVVIA